MGDKSLRGRGIGKPEGKKSPGLKIYYNLDTKPDMPGIIVGVAQDSKEAKKPHSTLEGRKASIGRSLKRNLGLAGGGIAQRGLGRAFNKGGKV